MNTSQTIRTTPYPSTPAEQHEFARRLEQIQVAADVRRLRELAEQQARSRP